MLFAGLGSVRIVKNCDLGLENAALGLRPQAAFSRPRSQFFTILTSQPANNIYILYHQSSTQYINILKINMMLFLYYLITCVTS